MTLDATGLTIPTIEELIASTVQDQKTLIDPNIDTSPEGPVGNLNGIFCNQIREGYEVVEVAYHGFDPDSAEDFLLDALCAITGTKRNKATPSKFTDVRSLTVNVGANKTFLAGSVTFAQAGNASVLFETTTNIISTTSGNYPVEAKCTVTGPVFVSAGTLTVIQTPVAGLNSVTNSTDCYLGSAIEQDPSLRLKREDELRATGQGTFDAIRARVLEIEVNGVSPVISCTVLNNDRQNVNSDGVPGNSFEVILFDGLSLDAPNNLIAQTIWNAKPAGILAFGSTFGTAIDSTGISRQVPFTRPSQQEVTMSFSIGVGATYIGDVAMKLAVVENFKAVSRPGVSLKWSAFVAFIMGQLGVVEVTTINLGAGAFTDLPIPLRSVAFIQTSGISITHV